MQEPGIVEARQPRRLASPVQTWQRRGEADEIIGLEMVFGAAHWIDLGGYHARARC